MIDRLNFFEMRIHNIKPYVVTCKHLTEYYYLFRISKYENKSPAQD